jgi:hypothetical protein
MEGHGHIHGLCTGLLYTTERKWTKSWKNIKTSSPHLPGVPLHCQVKHSIEITPGIPFPNGPVYRCSLLENEEIKPDPRVSPKRAHSTKLLTLQKPNHAHTEERWDLVTLY